jgi:hypothetical protein
MLHWLAENASLHTAPWRDDGWLVVKQHSLQHRLQSLFSTSLPCPRVHLHSSIMSCVNSDLIAASMPCPAGAVTLSEEINPTAGSQGRALLICDDSRLTNAGRHTMAHMPHISRVVEALSLTSVRWSCQAALRGLKVRSIQRSFDCSGISSNLTS